MRRSSWTLCAAGHTHWGPRGAAGLLVAEAGSVLLQLRPPWANRGSTWSVPGGALERGESGVQAALRESEEELGLDPTSVAVKGGFVADCGGGWTYETVFARPLRTLVTHDLAESRAHEWVAADAVDALPLHPSFRSAWEQGDSGLRAFVLTS